MVQAKVPSTPKKKAQKRRDKIVPPTYRLGLEELWQQPGASPTQYVPSKIAPWPRLLVNREAAVRRSSPQASITSAEPVQEPNISSSSRYQMRPIYPVWYPLHPFSLPGNITSTTNSVPEEMESRPPALNLTEEVERLAIANEEVVKEAQDYIAKMNSLGVFVDPSELMS